MATLTTSGLGRDRSAASLEDAMNEQARLAEEYERSLGTQRELQAYARLREANRRLAAFKS